MAFTIVYTDGCYEWLHDLPARDRIRLLARVDLVAEQGPGLGRPVVETIKGSRHANMKELRSGTMRVLFAFDPIRQAGSVADRWRQGGSMGGVVPREHPDRR